MKINFISNLDLCEISGGFSAMNVAAYDAMKEIAHVNYIGPVQPEVHLGAKVKSKASRILGAPGNFYFFSEERLKRIAKEVSSGCQDDAELDFFHGFTPWIRCHTRRPYVAWSDCSFQDYINIFHNPQTFCRPDIKRICDAEAEWLSGARGVFLSSNWASRMVQHYYGLKDVPVCSVGIFGAMEITPQDLYKGSRDFLFVSTDYQRKRGRLCREAMDIVWRSFPDARLKIIGDPPPTSDLLDGKVIYAGFLTKSNPVQLRKLADHFSTAFAIVHPTDADIAPLVLIEAAFFGCPAITVDDFAVPEVTGREGSALLLQRPVTPASLAQTMIELLTDTSRYLKMRKEARRYSLANHSRDAFKKRLQRAVLDVCSTDRMGQTT